MVRSRPPNLTPRHMTFRTFAALALPAIPLVALLAPAAMSQGAAPLFSGSTPILLEDQQVQAILDTDHDGDLDLLSWWWTFDDQGQVEERVRVSSFRVDVEGSVDLAWRFTTPLAPGAHCARAGTAVGDFDGDGFDDFAVGLGSRIFVYVTRAGEPSVLMESLSVPGTIASLTEIRAGDLNGDGLDDLVVVSENRYVKALLSNGVSAPFDYVGQANVGPLFGGSSNKVYLALLDYDQDGRQEVATVGDDRDRVEFLGVEKGALWFEGVLFTTLPYLDSIVAGDIDGDGDEDLVLFDAVTINDPGRYQRIRCLGPGNYAALGVRTGGPATHFFDIDADGDLDGLCCSSGGGCGYDNDDESTFMITLNNGNGLFDEAVAYTSLETGYDGLGGVMDMDGDGDFELVGGRSILTNHMLVGAPYCDPAENSTGEVGAVVMSGSASLTRSDLTLHASKLPPNKISIVLLGGDGAAIPIGHSLLCVGSPIKRYAIVTSDSRGNLDQPIPTASLPATYPGDVEAGDTRRFQVWHREPAEAGSFAFTEGVRVMFAP